MVRCAPVFLLFLTLHTHAESTVARIPVALEYPLLQYLLVTQLFTEPGKSREILQDPSDCSRVRLSEPQLLPGGKQLEIEARTVADLGISMAGSCRRLLSWRGRVRVRGEPEVMPDGRSVRLDPRKVQLFDDTGNALLSGPLWQLANDQLLAFFSGFVLDFDPHLQELKQLLPTILPRYNATQLQTTVDSLRVHSLQIHPQRLDAELQFRVFEVAEGPATAALSDAELAEFEERWQMMDALLVVAVKRYASAARLQPLRRELFDILIDSRYRMLEALSQSQQGSGDAVRHWFVESWQRLNPVVRSIALQDEQQHHWLWLTALTATDALYAIDRLGPGIGLEISTDGLRRLARMINADAGNDWLNYDQGLDEQLQQLWREQMPGLAPDQSSWRLNFSLFPRAQAASDVNRLNRWVPRRHELDEYLPIIEMRLVEASARVGQPQLQSDQYELFRRLLLSTAWQESCWRQYEVRNQRIEPLRSGTGDVGLMQINEHVWRGIYAPHKLRWDIDYNINAGAEILLNYLVSYALKRGEHLQPGGFTNLARASYSAYNGGPSQVKRYRNSAAPDYHRKVDRLFWEKYQQVDAGRQMNVAACLGRDPDSLKIATGSQQVPAAATSWVAAQPADHFTLQLGSFSDRQGATRFIAEQSLANAQVHSVQRDSRTLFIVVFGSYESRDYAAASQQNFGALKPWIRQFRDLQR